MPTKKKPGVDPAKPGVVPPEYLGGLTPAKADNLRRRLQREFQRVPTLQALLQDRIVIDTTVKAAESAKMPPYFFLCLLGYIEAQKWHPERPELGQWRKLEKAILETVEGNAEALARVPEAGEALREALLLDRMLVHRHRVDPSNKRGPRSNVARDAFLYWWSCLTFGNPRDRDELGASLDRRIFGASPAKFALALRAARRKAERQGKLLKTILELEQRRLRARLALLDRLRNPPP